jgi:hypothetical protein
MIRWLRVVLPPRWICLVGALFYVAFQASDLFVEWHSRQPFFSMHDPVMLRVFCLLASLYGVYRVWAVHPALRPGYYDWLASTPWNSRKPLPLGPIQLVWQDVLAVGTAVALQWPRMHVQSLHLVQVFLGSYLATLAAAHILTGEKLYAHGIGFGIGLMVLLFLDLPSSLIVVAATYTVAIVGLRRSLARFPWDDVEFREKGQYWVKATAPAQEALGWPYARLGPQFSGRPKMPLLDTLLLGLLAAWWCFVIGYHLGSTSQHDLVASTATEMHMKISGSLVIGGAAVRVFLYCFGYFPPISLMGRLALGRLLIPGYDQVFVAPFLAALIGAAMVGVTSCSGLQPLIFTSLGIALSVWILLGVGPGLDAWRLTGNHRIVPLLLNLGSDGIKRQ